MNKQVAYGYDDGLLTHQPRVVYDTVASKSYNLYWDLNGNLQEISNCKSEIVRFHSWDEENRLRAVVGPNLVGLYGYDGNGNRVWKLTGKGNNTSLNGGNTSFEALIDNAVLYPNPYITITPQGYTKHYYLGQERISTILGEGGWDGAIDNQFDTREETILSHYWGHFEGQEPFGEIYNPKITNENLGGNTPTVLQYDCSPTQLLSLSLLWDSDIFKGCVNMFQSPSGNHERFFFTHNDHLGSASWITDEHGEPVQYIHYAPYGELLASQKATGSSYDERYKFTGKERDAESGYDNFGARYYYPPLGIWTRPDPLLDKYIFYTPYMYCEGNPIVLRDPDGRLPQAVVGAVIGAAICGGIAIYNNKSWSEVGSAALGGAVAGAITAVTAGLASGGLASAIKLGMIGGAIGSAAGNSTEQGVNMAIGNQKGFDVQELGVSFVWGYGLGAVEGAGQYFIKSGANQLKVGVNAKYQSSSYKKFIRKEVIMEEKAAGNAYSKKTINSKMTNRKNDLKDLDNYMIETTDKTIEKGVIPATSNIIEDELR